MPVTLIPAQSPPFAFLLCVWRIDRIDRPFRFKDELLFFEFRSRTTLWPKAVEMDIDAAKALAIRINMEIEARREETDPPRRLKMEKNTAHGAWGS